MRNRKASAAGMADMGADAVTTAVKDTHEKHVTDRQNIAPNPLNARDDIDPGSEDIRQLGASLAAGQLQSIGVVPVDEFLDFDGYRALYADTIAQHAYTDSQGERHEVGYVAIGGGRRLVAAEVGNVPRLEISIHKGLAREDFLRLTVVENLERKAMTPLQEARQIRMLIDATGAEQAAVAAKLHRSPGFVNQRLALLDLPAEALAALDSGAITVTTARTMLSSIKREQETERTPLPGRDEPEPPGMSGAVADLPRKSVEDPPAPSAPPVPAPRPRGRPRKNPEPIGMTRGHRTALAYAGQPVAEIIENYEKAGFTAEQFAELGAAMIERSRR